MVQRTEIAVGTCVGVPGRLSYGTFEGPDLPTGGNDSLPVIIAQGRSAGPVLWLTANIHGNELAGIEVIHRLLSDDLAAGLSGSIVALPSLNPAGLRTNKRHPYYDDRDPNRTFPGFRKDAEERRELSVFERLSARLLEALRATANFYMDLHCASIRSVGFSIRDRVLYRDDAELADVTRLSDRLDDMVAAFGFPAVMEYRSKTYVAKELHRSTTGAALQELRIPSFTVELGPHSVVDGELVDASLIGLRNVMRWAGMLGGAPEPMPPMPRPPDGRRRRREDGPYPPASGMIHYLARPGDYFEKGAALAHLTDVWGRTIGDGAIPVSDDTWIIGLEDGILAYPGAAIAHIGILDEGPVVERWPL